MNTGDKVTMLGGFHAVIVSVDNGGTYPKARIEYDATHNRETVPMSSLTPGWQVVSYGPLGR